jgi:hypothetical protein
MPAKYQPSVRDQQANLRFQRKQAAAKPSAKPAPRKSGAKSKPQR